MIAVHFNKGFVERALDAIQSGKPILPPGGPEWTGNDMLMLAGVLYAAVFSQGPHTHQLAGIDEATRSKWPAERKEAVEETLNRDIHNGIDFLSALTFAVLDGEYDARHGPEVKAMLYEKEGGGKAVIPAKGFKGHKDML